MWLTMDRSPRQYTVNIIQLHTNLLPASSIYNQRIETDYILDDESRGKICYHAHWKTVIKMITPQHAYRLIIPDDLFNMMRIIVLHITEWDLKYLIIQWYTENRDPFIYSDPNGFEKLIVTYFATTRKNEPQESKISCPAELYTMQIVKPHPRWDHYNSSSLLS